MRALATPSSAAPGAPRRARRVGARAVLTTCAECCAADGACCYFSGFCQVVSQAVCAQTPLTIWRGPGTTCGASACPLGACCTGTNCVQRPEHACISSGGTWLGPGVPCTPTNPCAPAPCCQQLVAPRCFRPNTGQALGAMTFNVTGSVSANCCAANGVINSTSINVSFSQAVVPTLGIDGAGCVTSINASVTRIFNGATVLCSQANDPYASQAQVTASVGWGIGGFVTQLLVQGGTFFQSGAFGNSSPPTGANGGCFADPCTATQGVPANPLNCTFPGGGTPWWPLTGNVSVSVTAPSNWASCPNALRPETIERQIVAPTLEDLRDIRDGRRPSLNRRRAVLEMKRPEVIVAGGVVTAASGGCGGRCLDGDTNTGGFTI